MALLHKELRDIEEVKQFATTEMWTKLRAMMLSKVEMFDSSIVALSVDPEKNRNEIRNKYSLRFACKELVSGIERTLGEESGIKGKLKQLEGTLKLAELYGDNQL